MKMWKAQLGWTYPPKEVEVERITDNSVWVNGRRRGRVTEWESYYMTRDEAVTALTEAIEGEIRAAESILAFRRAKLAELQARLEQ